MQVQRWDNTLLPLHSMSEKIEDSKKQGKRRTKRDDNKCEQEVHEPVFKLTINVSDGMKSKDS